MLTRGAPKVGGGRQTYSARHLAELVGSTRQSAQIYYERETHVPAVPECFTRFDPGFDGRVVTLYAHPPVKTARLCGGGGSRGGYTRPERSAASRGADLSSYRSPYLSLAAPKVCGSLLPPSTLSQQEPQGG